MEECPGAVVMQGKCLEIQVFFVFIPCTKEVLIKTAVLFVFKYMFKGNDYKQCDLLVFLHCHAVLDSLLEVRQHAEDLLHI